MTISTTSYIVMVDYFNVLVVVKGIPNEDIKMFVKEMAKATNLSLFTDTKVYETESAETYAVGIRNPMSYNERNADKWLKMAAKFLSSYKDGASIDIEVYREIEIFAEGAALAAECLFKGTVSAIRPFNEDFPKMLVSKEYSNLEKKKIEMPRIISNES